MKEVNKEQIIMPADLDLMDYENATKDFKVEYSFMNKDGLEDLDDLVFSALDADDAERKFEQRTGSFIIFK